MFPAGGIVTVSGGMEGPCRGCRRVSGRRNCDSFRRGGGAVPETAGRQLGAASGGRPGILMRQAEADGCGRRRHRCGSSCATGAGRTAPAAGNGTEYRCAPAQGARRGPKVVPGHFPAVRRISAGPRRCTTAAPPAEITAGTPLFGQPRNRKPGKLHILNISLNYGMMNYYIF